MEDESILPNYPKEGSELKLLQIQSRYHNDVKYLTDNFNSFLKIIRSDIDTLPTNRQTIAAVLSGYIGYESLTESNDLIDDIILTAAQLELPSASFSGGKKEYDERWEEFKSMIDRYLKGIS